MTEAAFEPEPEPGTGTDPLRTGVEDVDAVLATVEDLDGADVAQHPAVFERAHEQLRRALDGSA